MARGWMYAKPTPAKVLAILTFPHMEPRPELVVHEWFWLTAICANQVWMRHICTRVEEMPARAKALAKAGDTKRLQKLGSAHETEKIVR